MSLSSTFGSRPTALSAPAAPVQPGARVVAAQTAPVAPASGNVAAPLPTVERVGLQEDIVSLSRQGLQARGVGASPLSGSDNAQSLLSIFARRLFGEEAQTASVSYNLSSFGSSAAFPSAGVQPGGPSGKEAASSYDLSKSFSFTGVGELSTEDGRSFEFEIKVKFEAAAQAASQAAPASVTPSQPPTVETPDVLVLTGKPLPAIKFPGSLDDLFKLLSRELRTEVSGRGEEGNMTLRLMRLVDRAALLAPRARPDDPEISPAERSKALAASYGNAPSLRDLTQA